MSASERDINLVLIANGKKAFYSSVKGCGHLIWDLRMGVYSSVKPDVDTLLDFLEGTDWEECTTRLDTPLEDPIYGSVTVDFDRRWIIDDNGYGASDQMFIEWLLQSIESAPTGCNDGLIPSASLVDHLSHGRIRLISHRGNVILLPANLDDARKLVDDTHENASVLYFAELQLPNDWRMFRQPPSKGKASDNS